MIYASKTLGLVSVALIASLSSGCSDVAKDGGMRVAEILSDREAVPPARALVRLQERPSFPVDGRNRPFAAIADGDERIPAGTKPLRLDESRPGK